MIELRICKINKSRRLLPMSLTKNLNLSPKRQSKVVLKLSVIREIILSAQARLIDAQKNVVKDEAEQNSKVKLVKKLTQWIVTLVLAVEMRLRRLVRVEETGVLPRCKLLRIMRARLSTKS